MWRWIRRRRHWRLWGLPTAVAGWWQTTLTWTRKDHFERLKPQRIAQPRVYKSSEHSCERPRAQTADFRAWVTAEGAQRHGWAESGANVEHLDSCWDWDVRDFPKARHGKVPDNEEQRVEVNQWGKLRTYRKDPSLGERETGTCAKARESNSQGWYRLHEMHKPEELIKWPKKRSTIGPEG